MIQDADKIRNNDVKSIAVNVNNEQILDIDTFKTNLGFKKDISIYHPNEIFACEVSKKIENNKLNNKDIRFIKSI